MKKILFFLLLLSLPAHATTTQSTINSLIDGGALQPTDYFPIVRNSINYKTHVPYATSSTAGIVSIGSGLSITSGGVLSTSGLTWPTSAGVPYYNGTTWGSNLTSSGTAPLTLTLSGNALTGYILQASSTQSGYVSSTDWTSFNSKISGNGSTGYLAKFNGTSSITGSSLLYETSTRIGIGNTSPSYTLDVNGRINGSAGVGGVGVISYGTVGTFQSGLGNYAAMYYSATYGGRFLCYDGSNYCDTTVGVITANVPSLTIKASNGYVGIGTTSPSTALQVVGTTTTTSLVATSVNTTSANTWSSAQSVTPLTATDTSGVWTFTAAASNTIKIALVHGETVTISNPSGTIIPGTDFTLEVKQSATGSDTITTWGTYYRFPASTAPTLSTTASYTDIVSCHVSDSTHIFCNAVAGFAQ